MLEQVEVLVSSIDPSGIVSARALKPERDDQVVICESGRRYLVRFAREYLTLTHEKWGYDALRQAGLPCPRVEAFVEPCEAFPEGCMVVEWLEAVRAAHVLERDGRTDQSLLLCERLGKAIRQLHSAPASGTPPRRPGLPSRERALQSGRERSAWLREVGLIDAAFEKKLVALVEKYAPRIPEPEPRTLSFGDLHLGNLLVYDRGEPTVAGFVDADLVSVGWPMWDFTNWERWELFYEHAWVREPILAAYGPLDMELYRLAVLLRFAGHHEVFPGSFCQQMTNAVESGDIMAFDLDKLTAS